MPRATYKKARKGSKKSYRLDAKGRLIGPDGKIVVLEGGDTPIVISGGSLDIVSVGELEDDDNPGQRTKSLHSVDSAKHISSLELINFKPAEGKTDVFVPTVRRCFILVHYE